MNRRSFLKALLFTGLTGLGLSSLSPKGALSLAFRKKEEFEPPLVNIPVGGLIRPPGAMPEREFRAKCISCGVCVNICHTMKYDAIAVVGLSDLRNLGTPYVKDMRDYPCGLCMECPKHCPTGALQRIDKEKVSMGQALIDFSLCFGWNGDVCLSCSKACPLGAFVFDFYNSEWGNQPYINERCVGCGLCVKYCPLGGSAVKVIKKEVYQRIRPEYDQIFNRLLNMSMEERYLVVYNENLPKILSRGRIHEREYR